MRKGKFKRTNLQGKYKTPTKGVRRCRGFEMAVEIWVKKLQLKSCGINFPLFCKSHSYFYSFSAGKSFKD